MTLLFFEMIVSIFWFLDDSTELLPPQLHQPPLTASTPSDDVNIHVHKEDGTGGGICAKIVFFLLFSALAVLIGLIITEHRGSTDRMLNN